MKSNRKLIYFLLPIFCASLTGCGTIPSYEDKGGSYVEATYTHPGLWEPSGHRMALCYEYGGGLWHSTIWPDTFGVFATNGVAIFTGFVADNPPRRDEPRATHERLFAVRSPDLPLDITDEILWRYSKESGEDFTKIRNGGYVDWKEGDNAVEFSFPTEAHNNHGPQHDSLTGMEFPSTSNDWNIKLDWNQISDVMREVKEKGIVRKDRVEHKAYIEKVFKPEVQK